MIQELNYPAAPIVHDTRAMGAAAWTHIAHPIKLEKTSQLANILSSTTDEIPVNSIHHQAILEQSISHESDLRVTARSPDGIVEAIERKNFPAFFIGIQCHIETLVAENNPVADIWKQVFLQFIRSAKQAAKVSR